MKCTKCEHEWTVSPGDLVCPFCGTDARLPARELDRMKSEGLMALSNKKFDTAASLLYTVAEQGDAQAQYHYATLLLEGRGVKPSQAKGVVFLKLSARQGKSEASLRLSEALKQMSLSQNAVMFWLRLAAAQGNTEAAHRLARAYEKGTDGMPPSLPHALYWYAQSSAGGSEEATLDLVRYYTEDGTALSKANARFYLEKVRNHRFTVMHYQRKLGKGECVAPALDKFRAGEELCSLGKLAEEQGENAIAASLYEMSGADGYAEGKYRLGLCLENGIGTEKDITKAAATYKEAADAGYSPAMTALGLLLRNSAAEGISSAVALSWIQKGANAGEPEAEYAMGCAYFGGTLARRDLIRAREWFGKAAEHGHEDAARRAKELDSVMEELFNRAKEQEQKGNLKEAFRFFQMAADMGHRDARCSVGICLQTGSGVKKNGAAAVKYYMLAAKGGSMTAVYNLGLCYFHGDGVSCDYRMAKKLLTAAKGAGYEDAAAVIEEMQRRKIAKQSKKLYSVSCAIYHRGDVENAVRFRAIAARMGSLKAMLALGCHYEFGEGLPYDHAAADQWYRKATAGGLRVGVGRLKNGFVRARKHRLDPRKKL